MLCWSSGEGAYATGFGAAGADALVLLLMDLYHYGFLIAQIFFGLWLIPLGYLAYTSGLFPRALGVVLVVGGSAYLVDLTLAFGPRHQPPGPRPPGHPARRSLRSGRSSICS